MAILKTTAIIKETYSGKTLLLVENNDLEIVPGKNLKNKSFSVVDLWAIRKGKRSFGIHRRNKGLHSSG